MASKTTIANWALIKLGESRVNNIETEQTELARLVSELFDVVRDSLIQQYPWKFAIKRANIAKTPTTSDDWGFDNKYLLPADYLGLYEIYNNPPYEVEGKYILTNEGAPLRIRYMSVVTDTELFPPLFAEALALKLDVSICDRVTQSASRKDRLVDEFNTIISTAMMVDAIVGQPDDLDESAWLEARL